MQSDSKFQVSLSARMEVFAGFARFSGFNTVQLVGVPSSYSAGALLRGPRAVGPVLTCSHQETPCRQDHRQSQTGDRALADDADDERAPALF